MVLHADITCDSANVADWFDTIDGCTTETTSAYAGSHGLDIDATHPADSDCRYSGPAVGFHPALADGGTLAVRFVVRISSQDTSQYPIQLYSDLGQMAMVYIKTDPKMAFRFIKDIGVGEWISGEINPHSLDTWYDLRIVLKRSATVGGCGVYYWDGSQNVLIGERWDRDTYDMYENPSFIYFGIYAGTGQMDFDEIQIGDTLDDFLPSGGGLMLRGTGR